MPRSIFLALLVVAILVFALAGWTVKAVRRLAVGSARPHALATS